MIDFNMRTCSFRDFTNAVLEIRLFLSIVLIVLVIPFHLEVALCLTEFRPYVAELDNVLIIVFFLLLVMYGCWFSEMVKKSSKLGSTSSLI